MYVLVNIDTSNEIDASEMHSSKKEYTPTTRYDAQFINSSQLKYLKYRFSKIWKIIKGNIIIKETKHLHFRREKRMKPKKFSIGVLNTTSFG